MESTLSETPGEIAGDMMHLLMRILIAALSVLAVIAVGDYLLQRFQFLKRNRMSRQEIKDEFKRTEGDPVIKARIKQMRAERARKRMMAEVPKATVIIANPTHYAVALRYEQGKTPAPICVAKGMDSLALRIREVAEEHKVPVVENAPLARTLYAASISTKRFPPSTTRRWRRSSATSCAWPASPAGKRRLLQPIVMDGRRISLGVLCALCGEKYLPPRSPSAPRLEASGVVDLRKPDGSTIVRAVSLACFGPL